MFYLLDFLQSIVSFFEMLADFVVNVLTALFQMLTYIPNALSFLVKCSGFVPSIILSFLLAGVSLSLLFMIVGRNT